MNKKKTHEEFVEEVKIKSPNIEVRGIYTGIKDYINVKCKVCGGEWSPLADSLVRGHGCPYCCNPPKKILIGFNNMWTTNLELAKLLENSEDGYKYTQYSNQKTNWKCPNCGELIKDKRINDVSIKGLSCVNCSDGISYPEKFMFNVLEQLKINIKPQLTKTTFKWCNKYKYDFYINKINCIVETHGLQHYEEINRNWDNLKSIQQNDKQKEQLAKENNIKNYIIIDCRKSELDWIKNSIMQSELPNILNFKEEDIDWLKCHEFACKSLVKVVCDLWNSGLTNIKEIANNIKMSIDVVRKYLKQGAKLNWCDYDSKKEFEKNLQRNIIKSIKATSKMVMCIETQQIYNSITEATKNVINGSQHISECCKGLRKSCGKLEDGTPLHWKYID